MYHYFPPLSVGKSRMVTGGERGGLSVGTRRCIRRKMRSQDQRDSSTSVPVDVRLSRSPLDHVLAIFTLHEEGEEEVCLHQGRSRWWSEAH